MHKSLSPSLNLALITGWILVVVAFITIGTHPNKALILGVGGFLGLVAGALQRHALLVEKPRFLAATSALEVRRAMMASKSGRLSIYVLWLSAFVLLVCAIAQQEGILLGCIAGYAAFALARDILALKGCLELKRSSAANNQPPEPPR